MKTQLINDRKEILTIMIGSHHCIVKRKFIPDSITTDTTCKDDISSITISSNQYLSNNNNKLKKDLATSRKKNKMDNDTIKHLHSRIKALESVVEKQNVMLGDKDYLLDAAESVNDKLQNRIHNERSDRKDIKAVINESNKLKSIIKNMQTYTKDLEMDYKQIETEMKSVEKKNSNLSSQLTKKSNKITELEENIKRIHHSNAIDKKRKLRTIERVANEVRESKSNITNIRKTSTIIEKQLSKVSAKKQRLMRKNRSLIKNVCKLKEKIVQRNEKIKIITDEKRSSLINWS